MDADAIQDALVVLRTRLERYRVAVEEVRGIVLDTPGLNGQAIDFDGRIAEWYPFALDALVSLDTDTLTAPGITQVAAWRVNQ